jgi:hypothetical protein
MAIKFLSDLAPFLALPWTTYANQKHSNTSWRILRKPMLIGVTFHCTFTSLHTNLDVYPLLQILITYCSANRIPRTYTDSSAAWEWRNHLVNISRKRTFEHVQRYLGTRVCLTSHTNDNLRPFLELKYRTKYRYRFSLKIFRVSNYANLPQLVLLRKTLLKAACSQKTSLVDT